ncbi:MAG TPA: DUF362 domain-containing protein [Candidatus Choladousia intestinavium]|uniref:DUF362 domain-containing protein n=1 Tax=Candidatus Choladousia intestinavium TaxID=2840727 RepID=A0A9D1AED2_9FIRM|nr:DUF362 domain-containing protein [Candidatus Choladousia intestinavium]
MEKNQILKIYGTDYKEMTKELLKEAGLAALVPDKNTRIGIKPNLVSGSTADYGATTHPEVVAGIIEYLQERGFEKICMLEGSWVGDSTAQVMELCGYQKLSEEYGIPFYDMQREKGYKKDCAGMELELCSRVKQVDFLINVPVLKGHCQTKITCALKNMKGLIPNREKRRFHSLGLHKPIAHLNAGIRQDFIVVDHICGDLDFEDGGNPVVRNCVMAARDPVLTDAYVCRLLHYETREVPYIELAEELGAGSADLGRAEIRILGQSSWEGEQLPYARKTVEVQDAVEEVESCSACYGYLIPALARLKEEGFLERLDTKICIGQGYRGKKGKLGIGSCTVGFARSLKGCPPTEEEIYGFMKQYLTENS